MNYFEARKKQNEFISQLEQYITDDICQAFNGTTSKSDQFWNNVGYVECVQVTNGYDISIEIVGRGFKYYIFGQAGARFECGVPSIEYFNQLQPGNPNYNKFDPDVLKERLDTAIKLVSYIQSKQEEYRQYVQDKLTKTISINIELS